ncbi:FecR family protein [Dongia sp. agr-C8]
MGRCSGLAAAVVTGWCLLAGATAAAATEVGAMAEVQRTVYGVPPQGSQSVKRQGDPVLFREALETVESSSALIRFIDDSTLALGAKSKVLIDAFVFDPAKAEGNALIRISVGTLRFVTGEMPKGKTVIKTPTATLVLRGTDVTVHVHPDGTTDATVNEGSVDGHNDITNEDLDIAEGQGATFGNGGSGGFGGTIPSTGSGDGGDAGSNPEQRRGGGSTHSNTGPGSSSPGPSN